MGSSSRSSRFYVTDRRQGHRLRLGSQVINHVSRGTFPVFLLSRCTHALWRLTDLCQSSGDTISNCFLSSGDTISNCLVAIRSIFSTCNALCQGGLLTLLDVPPSVCYPSGRRWQRRGPKPGEQRNLDLRIGRESANRHDDCQHQGGRGPAVRGKVNPGEVLIKVVRARKIIRK